ncbi:alpha-amylase family glycosyl hydrolase, partial [Jeotgalibaca porci]
MRAIKYFLPLLTFGLGACSPEANDPITTFPENPSVHDSVVVSIDEELYFSEGISQVTVDAQELGVPSEMTFDPLLNELSVTIADDLEIGDKTITVSVQTADGIETYEEVIQLTEPDEKSESLAFGWDEARIYFTLTDRFYNGDKTNDDPNNENYDTSHLETYHGGDFRGLIEKMPYLEELGINTLWITPIVDNIEWNMREQQNSNQYGYHGY